MEWGQYIDTYCERTDPGFWAEPLNAVTNAAFIVAAVIVWRRTRGAKVPLVTPLTAIVALIGVGSFLFHTLAVVWASVADVVPIGAFILVYLYAVNRYLWRRPPVQALALTAAFIPLAGLSAPFFSRLPWLGLSAGYAPVPFLIAIYAIVFWRRAPQTARGLAAGVVLLTVSLAFRTVDLPLCAVWPAGTHFIWHLLNAVLLGWMIWVYRVHMLAAPADRR